MTADQTIPPAPGRCMRAFLLVLVTITGATVLALEVLGTRVIGTHYGSSLFVWAALITVTLVCLSIGYAVGGTLADRLPRPWMLCLLVAAGGLSVLLVPLMTGVLAPLGQKLGLAGGAIASAAVLFFLPLTLLAMAGPYVIRLRARNVEGLGSTSGAVYALSTVGSVAGALAVSLWMIPTLGTQLSLRVCSAALIALAAGGLATAWGGRGAAAAALLAVPWLVPLGAPPPAGQLYETESAFGELRVLQRPVPGRGLYRMLMVNGIMQTGMPTDIDLVGPGAILQTDSYYLELLPYFYGDLAAGRKGVLIGLAGGMFPRVMEFYDIDWTAVEIDVKVAELAKAYFGYRGEILLPGGGRRAVDVSAFPHRASPIPPEQLAGHAPSGPYKGRAVIQDGRRFLADMSGKVDFVVLDAYNSDAIPFHLITREFFELTRSRLSDDGLLAINYIGPPTGDFVTDSLFRTLAEVFGAGNLRAYRTRDDESLAQVVILFAFRGRPRDLLPLWQADSAGGADRLSYELKRRQLSGLALAGRAGAIITDDLNPIDLARARTALAWRSQTMDLLK
jgi:spermidine synthase